LHVLSPFIARNSPIYANGGGLYALGLIYANYRWESRVIEIVRTAIIGKYSPVVKHGACLALGLIAMGSHEQEYYHMLLQILTESEAAEKSPEAKEAAGYAIGMVMLGCGPCDMIHDLLTIARPNEHEKVVRGIGMALALMMYGREDESETIVQALLTSRTPLLRQSAAWVIALAYVGTASNAALQRLLHLGVSDVNPDVRRAAVTGIGFVLSRSPKEVPGMVDLLAKSYHPHVRAGAALALGITCAGTGMSEAIAILEPLLEDLEEFVKQAAMIAMALVLQQQSDAAVPFAKKFRAYLRKLIKRKTGELEIFGLCAAYGIMNASGRNVVVSCNSLRGENSALPTVGLALFCNYFYWLPLTLMLPLAFHPTAVIGLDRNLQVADWKILSRGPASLYANPPSFESEKEEIKLTKATLSISTQVEPQPEALTPPPADAEEEFFVLTNPSRVTLNQLAGIDLNYTETYRPVTGEVFHGFVMLKEVADDEAEEDR
jgi:26S proteasome regulatory subunit N2